MKRRWLASRRAYPPRLMPPMVLAAAGEATTNLLMSLSWPYSVGVGIVWGVGVVQVRWMVWRWRHPRITVQQQIDDLRSAAPWN